VGQRGIEDAWLTLWRDASVEIGVLAAARGGVVVFHGALRYHDQELILLAPEQSAGTILIYRRAIAYIRPHAGV
jgi:hypothetical protein